MTVQPLNLSAVSPVELDRLRKFTRMSLCSIRNMTLRWMLARRLQQIEREIARRDHRNSMLAARIIRQVEKLGIARAAAAFYLERAQEARRHMGRAA